MIRDDLYKDAEYARSANHDEEHGRAVRKKVWKVTVILSLITAVEVVAGVLWPRTDVAETSWLIIKLSYIALTVVKAGYIVLVFMHLGDETKSFKWMVLIPYFIFISYLLFISFTESTYLNEVMRSGW
jgi:caa(3)-type oxidase subunit IV